MRCGLGYSLSDHRRNEAF